VASFGFKSGQIGKFLAILPTFCCLYLYQKVQKVLLWPKKVGKWPVLKTKVATEKRVNHAGLRVLWPETHFFSLLNAKKKYYFYKS